VRLCQRIRCDTILAKDSRIYQRLKRVFGNRQAFIMIRARVTATKPGQGEQ
jgi:hypothetical protein